MTSTSPDETDANAHTVLVVDDDAEFREELTEMIAESEVGWEVKIASDPSEAIRLIAANRNIECVFLDLNFPGEKSGIDFLRDIRDVFWTAPIYILSNYREDESTLSEYHTTRQEMKALGAVDWFQKQQFPDFRMINSSIRFYHRCAETLSAKFMSELYPCLTTYIPEVLHEAIAMQTLLTIKGPNSLSGAEIDRILTRLISTTYLLGDKLYRAGSVLRSGIPLPTFLEHDPPTEKLAKIACRQQFSEIYDFAVAMPERPEFLTNFSSKLAAWLATELRSYDSDQKFFLSVNLLDHVASVNKPSYLETGALTIGRYFADEQHADLAGAAVHNAAQKIQSPDFRETALSLERVALGYARVSGDHRLIKRIAIDLEQPA